MDPENHGKQTLLAVLGMTAGVAAGVWLWRRQQKPGYQPAGPTAWSPGRGSSADVTEALRRDGDLSRRALEVDAISDGVVELSGHVDTRSEAERAVRIAQSTRGVFTVVNRLVIDDEEAHMNDSKRRREDGAPELNERHHYGMGVGMGSRRQSPDTDPDRPSDKQKILDRELDVDNVEDAPEAGPDPVSGAEAVESSAVKPGDEDAIRDAGLDPSPRPNSTPKESVASDEGEAAGDTEVEEHT